MGKLAVTPLVVVAIAVAGCSADPGRTDHSDTTSAAPQPTPSSESQIYSAVLDELVLTDHTFGSGPTPFRAVYVLDRVVSGSSGLFGEVDGPPFGEVLENEIEEHVSGLPPVEFIGEAEERADPGRQGLTGVENDGIIVGLSAIGHRSDGTAVVSTGYWCGVDCGYGTTYVLDEIDSQWQVVQNVGPITIS